MSDSTIPVAYRVTVNDMTCVVFAFSKPKARWIAVDCYREAGCGRPGEWPSVNAVRAPELNRKWKPDMRQRAYDEEYL